MGRADNPFRFAKDWLKYYGLDAAIVRSVEWQ